jgi:hypothetical protein
MYRVCGTPTEEIWQGVTSLKNYKTSFPNWKPCPFNEAIKGIDLDPAGLDLLSVRIV